MDSILELLKSVPIVGWVIGGVIAIIGVRFLGKKGIGGSLDGISLDGILGNLRNNRKRTERAIDNNRVATESVDNAEERIEESKRIVTDAEERIVESQNLNDSAISTVESLTDGIGDSEDELDRAKSIIDRVRSRKSTD